MNKLGSSLHRTHDIKLNLLNLVINQWSLKKSNKTGWFRESRHIQLRYSVGWEESPRWKATYYMLLIRAGSTPKCGDCTARSSSCLHPQGLCTDLFTEEMKQQQGLSQQSLERLQVSSCLIYVMILSPKREAEWSYNCTTLPWNEQHED